MPKSPLPGTSASTTGAPQKQIPTKIDLPPGSDQVNFANTLTNVRKEYLLDALLETVKGLDMDRLDNEIIQNVPAARRAQLAGRALRGEIVYAVPYVLESRPQLVAYYRLLLGHSGKAFYETSTGAKFFESMETKNTATPDQVSALPVLCEALNEQASKLIDGVGIDKVSKELMDDLTLLTLGAQLRGGANTQRGVKAMAEVRTLVTEIVQGAIQKANKKSLTLKNKAGRNVMITLSGDPDLTITEEMGPGFFRNIVSVEVKGGTDKRNIYNRIGEAEKSHLVAKGNNFTEFWTILNVPAFKYDLEKAKKSSATTNQFYDLALLQQRSGGVYEDFKRRIVTYTGI